MSLLNYTNLLFDGTRTVWNKVGENFGSKRLFENGLTIKLIFNLIRVIKKNIRLIQFTFSSWIITKE